MSNAIIAGGAIRDLYFNILARDIDVFILDPDASNYQYKDGKRTYKYQNGKKSHFVDYKTNIEKLFEITLFKKAYSDDCVHSFNDSNSFSSSGNLNLPHITKIWQVIKNRIPFDVIFLDCDPVTYVNKYFDIGLCKAYCDGHKLTYTADFFKDVQNKTFTIVGEGITPKELKHIINHHIPKLRNKYPGYVVQLGPHTQQYHNMI
jgi:hypothetical protein